MNRGRFVLLGLLTLLGCGPRVPDGPPTGDAAVVRALVGELADTTERPEKFRNFFADNAAPADTERVRYQKLYFEAVANPKIEGTTATVKVEVRDNVAPPKGPVEWIFVKEGERWKLRSAPLP